MYRISDMFAFGGGCQGSGCKSPPPARGRQQGQDEFFYNGFFLSTREWEGALTTGRPCAQSNGTSPGEPAAVGMRNRGGGDPFTLGRGSGAGQPVVTACTQQGDKTNGNKLPGLCSHGDPPPVQGGGGLNSRVTTGGEGHLCGILWDCGCH
jgi:hypothetical protein